MSSLTITLLKERETLLGREKKKDREVKLTASLFS